MRNGKRIFSILLATLLLMMATPFTVSAAGTQEDPIDAATKWFGYGVDTYLLNPTLAAGNDGIWYTLTADKDGILALEHKYKDVDYTITISVNGQDYVGGSVDSVIYNGPIMTLPMQAGDVATIAILTKENAAGTVYASMKLIAGNVDDSVKVKSEGITVYVAAGATVYFQDDSLQGSYASKGLLVEGDVADTVFYAVTKNTESGTAVQKAYTDSDADGIIEASLGGSQGSAGAPPVKPAWAIENNSDKDQRYTLTIAAGKVHECVYDDDADVDCNSCGAIRELPPVQPDDHVEVITFGGSSVSENKNGLAFKFDVSIENLVIDQNHVADYSNATILGEQVIMMGAVLSNNGTVPSLDDVTGINVVKVEAIKAFTTETGYAYAVRVINIPDAYKDTIIHVVPYYLLADGTVVYGDMVSASYN